MRRTTSTLERGSGLRLLAFAGLSALAAWRYAGVEARAPAARLVATAVTALVAGCALMLLPAPEASSRRERLRAAGTRVIALVALLAVALLLAGVPAHLLRPARWAVLAGDLHRGLESIATTLWPYRGDDRWTRLDILLAFALAPIAAAAIAFWPTRPENRLAKVRYGIRQVLALALLMAVYVTGVVDSGGGAALAEGLLLLALTVAWLWLPGLRMPRAAAALAWVAAAGAVAAALTSQIGGGRAWLNYRAWNLLGSPGAAVSFAWDQTYGPIPWSRSQETMFTVSAPRRQLWKTTTLDRFDGLRFVRSDVDARGLGDYEDLPLPLNPRWYEFSTFTVRGLRTDLLPTGQGTTAGVNSAAPVQHDDDGTVHTVGSPVSRADSYTVLSYAPAPTPGEMRAAPRTFPAAYLRYTDFDLPAPAQTGLRVAATDPPRPDVFETVRTVGAPAPGVPPAAAPAMLRRILASPYGPMYRLARGLASGSRSSYDVAMAVERYLKQNYLYSEQPPPRRYPLESFLFVDRLGYCQQFSGAMALMLRMDGIPARVAAGFLPGAYDGATRTFVVRAVDAHSWVEVYFAGIGWVPFDPTPPRSVGKVPAFPLYTSERTVFPYAALAATVGSLPRLAGNGISPARHARAAGPGALSLLARLAAGLAALAALLAVSARWLVGSARLRRSLAGDGELASRELVRALSKLGYEVPPTVTLARVESLVRLHGGADAARYVRRLRERRYAPGADTAASLEDRRRLRLAMTAHLGLDARLRGLWALPPATVGWRLGPPAASDTAGALWGRPAVTREVRRPAPRRGPRRTRRSRRGHRSAGRRLQSRASRES